MLRWHFVVFQSYFGVFHVIQYTYLHTCVSAFNHTYRTCLLKSHRGYVLDKVWKTPRGMGQMTFMDFNADGTIDVMFPTCYPSDTCAEDNSIHVFFNVQKPMCGAFEVSDSCRSQQVRVY